MNRSIARQLTTFGIVGIAATAVHYAVALTFLGVLPDNVYVANLAGYLCAVLVSYFGHGLLTFRAKLTSRTFLKFAAVSVSTFLLSELLLLGLEQGIHLPHRFSLGIVVIAIPLLSFALNKFWVYESGVARYPS